MSQKAYNKEQSRIAMKILTKSGFENFVWYNFLNENHLPNQKIIQKMYTRFKKSNKYSITNVLQFYEDGILINKIIL